jgi:hypothetical protein
VKLEPKQKEKAFVAHASEWIQLKAERQKFCEEIEVFRKDHMNSEKKGLPEYFRKRKENQQRRRKEKHALIFNNQEALEKIFGKAIYQKGWPVGRKEIKLALGIDPDDDEDDLQREAYAGVMKMMEKNRSMSKKRAASKSKVRLDAIAKEVPESHPSKRYHQDRPVSKSKGKSSRGRSNRK